MRIVPIKTGSIYCNKSVLTYGKGFDRFVEIPSISWYLEQDGHRILVDTGMCSTRRAQTHHYPGSRQESHESIDEALKLRGIRPEEIEIIILTHLHWDHCANLDKFPNATIYVQRAELEYAHDPIPPYYRSYESPHIGLKAGFEGVELRTIEGDMEIVKGVETFLTPGHSPGHQSVLVHGATDRYVIAGDACLCHENLRPDSDKGLKFTMIGRYMDVNLAWRSLERIDSMQAVVLPAHEVEVLTASEYL